MKKDFKKIKLKRLLISLFYLLVLGYYIYYYGSKTILKTLDIVFLVLLIILFVYHLIILIKKLKN